jgi:two-component system chemotaxis response regulator CheY
VSQSSNDSPILVVDDDPAIRETVASVLEMEGYSHALARDGLEALEIAERIKPSAVLLDMRMPIMDGWGFAREARKRGHSFPIVVMTAAENARRWCDEIGGDACVPKPFELDDLLSTIEKVRRN